MKLSKNNNLLAELLNDLITINYARISGYNRAREKLIDNTDLKAIFVDRATQSLNFIADLKTLVVKTQGELVAKIPGTGKIYRSWMNIKNTFNLNKNASILDSCEFEEDGAVRAYEEALKSDAAIPDQIRLKILEQQNEIRKSHDFIKNFRDFNLDLTS